jgi:hypothetical protein
MSLELLLRISVLRAELLGLARDLSPEEQRIVVYSANILRLLNLRGKPSALSIATLPCKDRR